MKRSRAPEHSPSISVGQPPRSWWMLCASPGHGSSCQVSDNQERGRRKLPHPERRRPRDCAGKSYRHYLRRQRLVRRTWTSRLIALDTSAIGCIAFEQPEAGEFLQLITNQDCLLSAPTLFEADLVLRHRLPGFPLSFFDTLVARRNIGLVDFTPRHATLARGAFDRFGRGRHAAGLNYGDCMSYAVGKQGRVSLLFKGDHFAKTDIASVQTHS